jgi:tRNA(fMet)-specific endonuclease VapC
MLDRRYLLDTNIISHLYRQPQGVVFQKLQDIGEEAICTSIVVAAELRFGAAKRGAPALTTWVENILAMLEILPLGDSVDRDYAAIRTHLEQTGQVIGANDLLIAAHARSLGMILVTDNAREFARVPGLLVENWL